MVRQNLKTCNRSGDGMTNTNYAMQRTVEIKKPSVDKSIVWNWIMVPAIFLLFTGFMAFAGIGMAVTASTNRTFVFGIGLFGGGALASLAVAVKSWSFDKTGETKSTKDIPIFYTPTNEAKPHVGGNAAVVVSHKPVRVEYKKSNYSWSKEQLNRAQDRFDNENWSVARDHLIIATKDYPQVKYIMTNLELWEMNPSGAVEWSQAGIDWHEEAMRQVSPH